MKIIPNFFSIILSKINYSIPDNHTEMVNTRIKGIIEDSKELSKKGDVFAYGTSTQDGCLALGRYLNVAFMPWRGYIFEDAIVINERLVKEDVLTSIHMKEFEVEIRDTRRGEELSLIHI